jgi:hypothetical protein
MTKAFQTRAFSRVSGCDGGAPRAAAKAVAFMEIEDIRLEGGVTTKNLAMT